ncbi:hypothetical protein BDZ89DRAFT_924049, partial [Hymenopellis radicata]
RQRASHGNVCIHPHKIIELASALPLPINKLLDEIVVIIVSNDQAATAEMFQRMPLLVQPAKVLEALRWLRTHNWLYRDIKFDPVALSGYNPDGHLPYPVQYVAESATTQGQNTTYVGHGVDTTDAIFALERDESEDQIPLTTTGAVSSFIFVHVTHESEGTFDTSQSSETVYTRHNPDVYGQLWPTLFPYGVDMFEDPVWEQPSFRHI